MQSLTDKAVLIATGHYLTEQLTKQEFLEADIFRIICSAYESWEPSQVRNEINDLATDIYTALEEVSS